MFVRKLSRFSALGPMKYELMTWCGLVSLADGDGILKIARQTRIQPTIDITVAFLAVSIETSGESLDIYQQASNPSLHDATAGVQRKPPTLMSCMCRHGGEVAVCPMHSNGERRHVCMHYCVYITAESYFSCCPWGGEWRLGSYTGARRQLLRRGMMKVLDNAPHDRQSSCSIFVYHAYC